MTNGRQVIWFLAAVALLLTVMVAAVAEINDVAKHYGWDGCETVRIGNHTARVCDR